MCDVRWESSQLNSTLKISLVSPLSRFAQRFLHKKNSLHNIMAEQGPKVGDARSLWNFTPSPGILLYVFFLSLSLFARVCCDDDDVFLGFGDFRLAFEFLKRWCENDAISRPPSRTSLSLSRKRDYSRKRFRFCASLVLSLKTCTNVFFFIFNAQHAHQSKQDGRNRRLKI